MVKEDTDADDGKLEKCGRNKLEAGGPMPCLWNLAQGRFRNMPLQSIE